MKKAFSLSLSLVIAVLLCLSCVCLTSCEKQVSDFNGMDTQEAYAAALAAFALEDNYTVVHQMDIKTQVFWFIRFTASVTATIKIDGRDYEQLLEYDAILEEEDEYSAYVDEVFYEDLGYGKTKYNLAYEDEHKYVEGSHTALIDLPAEWLISADFYESKGETYIKIIVDGQELYDHLLGTGSTDPLDGDPTGDASYYIYLNDDGTISQIRMEMDFVMVEDGLSIDCQWIDTMIYSDFGDTVVSAPADADSYHLSSFGW